LSKSYSDEDMMKILVSAYTCEPGSGSEEGVGWNMAVELAKYYETWVITRTIFRSTIEEELIRNPVPSLHFVYFDPFGWTEDWRGRQGAVQLHYYLWQIEAYFVGRSLHRQIGFDLVRHATYVKFWSPSFLALLPVPLFGDQSEVENRHPSRFGKSLACGARFTKRCETWVNAWVRAIRLPASLLSGVL
jgi:hypothetical protein